MTDDRQIEIVDTTSVVLAELTETQEEIYLPKLCKSLAKQLDVLARWAKQRDITELQDIIAGRLPIEGRLLEYVAGALRLIADGTIEDVVREIRAQAGGVS